MNRRKFIKMTSAGSIAVAAGPATWSIQAHHWEERPCPFLSYRKQTYVTQNDEIPIRFIELNSDREYILCTISNVVGKKGKVYSDEGGSQFKLDPHTTWNRNYSEVCFNGAPEGERQVFLSRI